MATWPVELMEPMRVSEGRDGGRFVELAARLQKLDTAFEASVPQSIRAALADLVRSMNCYYSNLIEGHNTRPRDIDRALAQDYSDEPAKRELQEEAKAHIEVQRLIDRGEMPAVPVTAAEWLYWCHREFYERIGAEFRVLKNQSGKVIGRVTPGELRTVEISVGAHQPPPAADLPRFLARFHEAYQPDPERPIHGLLALGASHHRLLWIHPFTDGNGRVARLFSHAYLQALGLCKDSLWSVSRGLARKRNRYRNLLAHADADRRSDLDGRGHLSEIALLDFSNFFLQEVAIDQVEFMQGLMQTNSLRERVLAYVRADMAQKKLPSGSDRLINHALTYGSLARGEAATISGYSDRQAREAVAALSGKGLLASDSPRGKQVRLNFSASLAEAWFPELFAAGAAESAEDP